MEELRCVSSGRHVVWKNSLQIFVHPCVPKPPRHVQQMKYGCDWLSMSFKGDTLHLFFIESNLSRNGRTPTLTKTEKRFQKAIKQGDLITHYIPIG